MKVEYGPIMKRLSDARVLDILRTDAGKFSFTEACDQYFDLDLTREEVLELAKELEAIANQ